ncbi:MAG: TetR/AcrR family transcriptional regulator [Pseudomonadota bacterium]
MSRNKTNLRTPRRAPLRRTRAFNVAENPPLSPSNKSTARRNPKRRQIIDGAISAMDRYGFTGATVSKITEEAGVSRGAYLHHFETKHALYEQVAIVIVDELFQRFAQAWPEQSRSEPELRQVLHDAWDQAFMRAEGKVYLELLHAARTDEIIAQHMRRPALRALRIFGWAARRRIAVRPEGSLSSSDIVRLTQWFLRGMSLDVSLARDPKFFHTQIDLLVELIATQLAA